MKLVVLVDSAAAVPQEVPAQMLCDITAPGSDIPISSDPSPPACSEPDDSHQDAKGKHKLQKNASIDEALAELTDPFETMFRVSLEDN